MVMKSYQAAQMQAKKYAEAQRKYIMTQRSYTNGLEATLLLISYDPELADHLREIVKRALGRKP